MASLMLQLSVLTQAHWIKEPTGKCSDPLFYFLHQRAKHMAPNLMAFVKSCHIFFKLTS